MPQEASLAALKEVADPVRCYVIEKLAQELGVNADSPLTDAELMSKQILKTVVGHARINNVDNTANNLAKKIKDSLIIHWPFLKNPWHPQTHSLVTDQSEDVVRFIEEQSGFPAWKRFVDRAGKLRSQDLERERKWAKTQRFILTAKSIVRAENLRREASDEVLKQYEQMMQLENSVLIHPLSEGSKLLAN